MAGTVKSEDMNAGLEKPMGHSSVRVLEHQCGGGEGGSTQVLE